MLAAYNFHRSLLRRFGLVMHSVGGKIFLLPLLPHDLGLVSSGLRLHKFKLPKFGVQ